MRPALLLVPALDAPPDALEPLALLLSQAGWSCRVVVPDDVTGELGLGAAGAPGEAVVVAHGAAGADLDRTMGALAASGWSVRAAVLLDGDLPADLPARRAPPMGYLRLSPTRWAESAAAAGWPVRDAPGGHRAATTAPRQIAGPLLRLLGDLGVPGGLA